MRQILFVQGAGEGVHDRWDNTLVESLRRHLGSDYEIRYPPMPNEADPEVESWGLALEHEIATLHGGAVVVGHSVGGAILINRLAERAPAIELGAIVLIAAPFVGPGGWTSDDINVHPDIAARLPQGVPVLLYHGDADTIVPVAHLGLYAATIPHAHVRQLAGRDHQLDGNLSEVANDIRALDVASQQGKDARSSSRR